MTKNTLFFLSILTFALFSCNKGCDFPDDVNSGDIITDAIVFGGNTGGVASVHHEPSQIFDLKVSFDEGYTYVPMDSAMFTKYSIINFPITAGCNTRFEREVKINSGSVKYTIDVESCPDCEEEYRTDNWVLVKKFSSSLPVDRIKNVQ